MVRRHGYLNHLIAIGKGWRLTGGKTDMLIPVPLRLAVKGEPAGPLNITFSVALSAPNMEGVNLTFIVHEVLVGKVVPHEVVWLKSAELGPRKLIPRPVAFVLEPLVTV